MAADTKPGPTYVVAGCKPWNRSVFDDVISRLDGRWVFIGDRRELTLERLRELDPRYVFFLHWSWRVPLEITEVFDCVCFHMTDVPYGRGGSPLQNLLVRGHTETVLTALKMTEEVDAGPVYLKTPLSLAGGAEEILIRATIQSAEMIRRITKESPTPVDQTGEVVRFRRRTPDESEIPQLDDLGSLYDFIRMLDAEGYPHAFLNSRGFRFLFRRATLYDKRIEASVTITPDSEVDR